MPYYLYYIYHITLYNDYDDGPIQIDNMKMYMKTEAKTQTA